MTVEEMKRCKKEKGYTYAQIAELSGVPLGTVQKIFCGETSAPRYDTIQALERLFLGSQDLREPSPSYQPVKEPGYTVEDYRALPDEKRVELIDGVFYDMSAPIPLHQRIAGEIHRQIANYILENDEDCIPFISPIDVQLDCDENTMVQPDVAILCHREKGKKWGIWGAPDFILEVISPTTKKKDYTLKLGKYIAAKVREYWIFDPYQEKLIVYFFEDETFPMIYGLEQSIPVNIYSGDLRIDMKHILRWIEEWNKLDI